MFQALRRVRLRVNPVYRSSDGGIAQQDSNLIRRKWNSSSSTHHSERMKDLRSRVRKRFPDTSPKDLPAITASFLILHELTAILPLGLIYFMLQSSGLGDEVLTRVDAQSTQGMTEDRSSGPWAYLQSKMRAGIQEGTQKMARISKRYSITSEDESPTDEEAGLSSTAISKGGFLVNGVAAYLIVKVSFLLFLLFFFKRSATHSPRSDFLHPTD